MGFQRVKNLTLYRKSRLRYGKTKEEAVFRKILIPTLLTLCVLCVSCNNLFQMLVHGGDITAMVIEEKLPDEYTITFDLLNINVTSPPAPVPPVTRGESITPLPTLTHDDFDFIGWYDNKTFKGTNYSTDDSYKPGGKNPNVTLYAKWEYEVEFDENVSTSGDTVDNMPSDNETFVVGILNTLPTETPERDGYRFDGWNTKDDGTGENYKAGTTSYPNPQTDAGPVTLYAKWIPQWTITFNPNNPANRPAVVKNNPVYEVNNSEYKEKYDAGNVTLPHDVFTRKGYEFTGWNTDADSTGTSCGATDNWKLDDLTSDTTFYAIWVWDDETQFKITFDPNDEDATGTEDPMEADPGTVVLPNDNTTEYTLAGKKLSSWNTSEGGGGDSCDDDWEFDLTDDITLYAIWEDE